MTSEYKCWLFRNFVLGMRLLRSGVGVKVWSHLVLNNSFSTILAICLQDFKLSVCVKQYLRMDGTGTDTMLLKVWSPPNERFM